jgi:hypothetical protein
MFDANHPTLKLLTEFVSWYNKSCSTAVLGTTRRKGLTLGLELFDTMFCNISKSISEQEL